MTKIVSFFFFQPSQSTTNTLTHTHSKQITIFHIGYNPFNGFGLSAFNHFRVPRSSYWTFHTNKNEHQKYQKLTLILIQMRKHAKTWGQTSKSSHPLEQTHKSNDIIKFDKITRQTILGYMLWHIHSHCSDRGPSIGKRNQSSLFKLTKTPPNHLLVFAPNTTTTNTTTTACVWSITYFQ